MCCAPPILWLKARQIGMAVQLPLAAPNEAVDELHVQPEKRVSLASRTAPT